MSIEKFGKLDVLDKKVILGYMVYAIELEKRHIGKNKAPFYGLDNGTGFYWAINVKGKEVYQGPFRKVKDAFKDAADYLENKEGEL